MRVKLICAITILIFLAFIAGAVSALSIPAPVNGRVTSDSGPIKGELVTVLNTVSGQFVIGHTNDYGEYGIDAHTIARNGESLEVSVLGQKQTFLFDTSPIVANFHITDYVPECKVCEVCKIEDCPECPEENLTEEIVLIVLLLILGSYTYSLKLSVHIKPKVYIRYKKDGVEHLHIGRNSYHTPDIKHRNPRYRHKIGEVNPLYEKQSDGKYKYVG